MKTKRFALLCALILICCGGLLCGMGIAMGGEFHNSYGVHLNTTNGGGFGIGVLQRSEGESDYALIPESFSQLEMDIAIGDIRIVRGSQLRLDISDLRRDQFDVTYENDVMKLTSWANDEWFGIHFFDYQEPTFTLTLPDDMDVAYVNITSNLGDVKISNVSIDSLHVHQHMGEIELIDVTAEDMELFQDMGDIVYDGAHPGNMRAENHMGDIEVDIDGNSRDYAYSLSTSMGEIKVNGRTQEGISQTWDGGNHDARYRLNLDNDMGDIELEFDDDFD